MFAELLLEIGTEEIPSGYLDNGLKEFKRLAESFLKDNRIEMEGELRTYGTMRRLVLTGKAVADRQQDTVQEITGPPKHVAFDKEGKPTKAAFGFAKKQGISVDDIQTVATPKGEYLYVKRIVPGRPTVDLLSEFLPELIANIPWPKSMRWGSEAFIFVRPIHWMLALFNGKVIPFEVAGVRSGNKTRGHRFMAPKDMEVTDFQDYLGKLNKSFVIIDYEERKAEVEKSVTVAAGGVSGTILEDPELLSTVTNMVEFPCAVCGSFDKAFLSIPGPVLITAMKEHQKYFSVYDQEGRLMPNFVAVNNTVPSDESVIRRGHERVLRARLADADFFFKEDRKKPLQDRLEDLKGVIYKAELGTSFDKVQRFTRLAEYLAEQIAPEKIEDIGLASALCKCDLVTEMVMEFPSLQGVIGKEYARLDGHPEDVCTAILEHYMPVQAESELPGSLMGSIVGMADRMDTIVGSFALGLEPTGTADPYALRRQTLAILRIVRDKQIAISIPDFVNKSASALRKRISFDLEEVKGKVIHFIKDRFKNILLSEGIAHDLIEAVITVDFNFISQTEKKIEAIKQFRGSSEDFEVIATAFKRVKNIIKGFEGGYSVNPGLFKDSSEEGLWSIFESIRDEAGKEIDKENYFDALNLMVRLGAPLDEFFSQVMVMTEDKGLKENRIGMLKEIHDFVIRIADISRLSA